ncbi:sulfotransferase family protein [Allosphingosinicella deserti]|uniref:Sulfotransferase family protein n=1 Tax=Allosphingosinicella deserti TaxID=2116704 RepID=A0A2P7QG51_9SPHN|nr:sulfotransferase [Sphingomonas deserti]PSJ36925.1 hypothetical protein C7I55_24785 [Sphingomonas deserti]
MIVPICITGMHRSGTSLVAGLLNACGLSVGDDSHLLPASSDNPLGYWEDSRFVQLNDDLLRHAGGTWDRPPADPIRPRRDPRGLLLRLRARRLLRRSAQKTPWSWKDPRTSLAMPFWLSLVPSLKVIICLRHPAKVEESLRRRDHTPSEHGAVLWRIYNERLLATVPRAQRLIVLNHRILADPEHALRPILAFAGLPPERAEDPAVAALVRPDFQRTTQIPERSCGAAIDDLYARMAEEAESARHL